jgi:uncharacterized membrane protein YagU involved in acid resistance
MQLAARVLVGAVAGLAATAFMDGVGTIIWEHMSETARKREREVEPKFPLTVLGERIAGRFNWEPIERNGERVSTVLHWGIGLVCGALHGLIERVFPPQQKLLGQPIAMGMLAVDEFGLSAVGLCPQPSEFPYETHVRAVVAHVSYGLSLAVTYEAIRALVSSEKPSDAKPERRGAETSSLEAAEALFQAAWSKGNG